jgi:hypothetical protein
MENKAMAKRAESWDKVRDMVEASVRVCKGEGLGIRGEESEMLRERERRVESGPSESSRSDWRVELGG